MDHQTRELLKYYDQFTRFYEQNYARIYAFIESNPYCQTHEVTKFCSINGIEATGSAIKHIVADIRRLINIEKHKVQLSMADVEMPTLEDGDTSKFSWKEIKHDRLLVLSDIHFPYHDKEAIMLALRYGKEHNIDSILLNGDILDFYQLSKFAKDGRKPSIRVELDIFRSFIDQLKQRFPEATIYYKMGNHEVRLERWIQMNAQMFDGLFDLERLVDFNTHGIVYLKDNIGVKFGKLHIIHGHEIRSGMGVVNIARTYYLKAQTNLLFGHWHQQQEYISRTMEGSNVGAWATGCLCKLDAEYTYGINQWVHGFAVVDRLDDAGNFRVKLKKIIGGEVV